MVNMRDPDVHRTCTSEDAADSERDIARKFHGNELANPRFPLRCSDISTELQGVLMGWERSHHGLIMMQISQDKPPYLHTHLPPHFWDIQIDASTVA